MKKIEYLKVKNKTYIEYCDYLQAKYGIGLDDYMTENYNKKKTVTRTKEGLFVHHKMEDRAILLSEKSYAMKNPFEYQKKENLIYCDFLEHLLLHILIVKYPSKDKNFGESVGIGGVKNFIVPELNDLYSGYPIKQEYKKIQFDKVKGEKEVYIMLIKQFVQILLMKDIVDKANIDVIIELLTKSFNEKYKTWKNENNELIYHEIESAIYDEIRRKK